MGKGLHWQPHEYYTYNLLNNKDLTLKEMQAEYNRLRILANSRLERLKEKGFSTTEAFQRNVGQYEKTAKSYSRGQLARKMYQLSRFIGSEQGSVQGQRRIIKKTVKRLNEHGYDFITADNLKEFGEFLEEMRVRAGGRLLDSDRVAEVFGVARNLKVDKTSLKRDFDFWVNNIHKLEKMKPLEGDQHDSDDYLKILLHKDEMNFEKAKRKTRKAKRMIKKLK